MVTRFAFPRQFNPFKAFKPLIACIALVACSVTSVAHAKPQSWCASDEAIILNGQLGRITFSADAGTQTFSDRGLVSLCARPLKPPFEQITYRFGKDRPELVYSAPEDGPMFLDHQQILPRAGVDSLYFRRGEFTYAITDCNGMHCGLRTVRLMVYKGKTRVLSLSAQPEGFQKNVDFLDDLLSMVSGKLIQERKSGLDYDEK